MGSAIRLERTLAWALLVVASATLARADATGNTRIAVPLGGSLSNQAGDHDFGVYVPTRFGGVLTITTSSGKVEQLIGPDGKPRENGQEVGTSQHGWYTFRIVGADQAYQVETSFVQVGQSAHFPWNFYYWPTKGDCVHEPWAGGNARVDTPRPYGDDIQVRAYGSYVAPGEDIILPGPNGVLETPPAPGDTSTWFPNMYDDLTWRGADGTMYSTPAPMLKYDQLFGLSARNWEAANSQNLDIQRWPGHCLGGAIASIMLSEPQPAPGTGMTKDELKALWAELGENHYNHVIGDNVNGIPAGPPQPGPDACDPFVPKFHQMLEYHLRGQHQAILGNLRAFPPTGKPFEVWNHGIGKYTAKLHAVPGQSVMTVRVETELMANSGSNLNEQDPKPRTNTYEYIVTYGPTGDVNLGAMNYPFADWIGVGGEAMYCPLNLMEVRQSRWQGHNPLINEGRVRSLDLANGGAGGPFLTAKPPSFRPVGTYEAGMAPMLAGGMDFNPRPENNLPSQPRRGLFRSLFGGP